MTDKHTPGPWGAHELLSDSENHHGYVLTAPTHKPSSHRIAIGEFFPMDSNGNEGRANVALAAAAPLMLAALREADSWFTRGRWAGEEIDAVRAAIAAATGE